MRSIVFLWLAAATMLVAAGCGSDIDLGEVSGTVTLDNQPLQGATVKFQPLRQGAPSVGVTDNLGKYSLQFTRDKTGAVIGEHRVEITTYREENPDDEPPTPRVPEKVPMKYNVESELTAKVDEGSNTRDFSLTSDGRVRQPEELAEDE